MATFAPSIDRMSDQVYLVLAYDTENQNNVRNAFLDDHLEFIEKNYNCYLSCGPLRLPGEKDIIGSFFIIASENEDKLNTFLYKDPYFKNGLYGKLRILSATPAAGSWMGGVIWNNAGDIRPNAT
jgi:uncharacterized protein